MKKLAPPHACILLQQSPSLLVFPFIPYLIFYLFLTMQAPHLITLCYSLVLLTCMSIIKKAANTSAPLKSFLHPKIQIILHSFLDWISLLSPSFVVESMRIIINISYHISEKYLDLTSIARKSTG